MKGILFLATLVLYFVGYAQVDVYTSTNLSLHLAKDGQFMLYPKKDIPIWLHGSYFFKEDSIIFFKPSPSQEKMIYAIYIKKQQKLQLVYKQGVSIFNSLPFKLNTRYNKEGILVEEWRATSKNRVEVYTYSNQKNLLKIEQFLNGKLEGKQLTFFDTPACIPSSERYFKNGLKKAKWYYYDITDEAEKMVSLKKIEVYKNNKLMRVKKPANPPIYYTAHF